MQRKSTVFSELLKYIPPKKYAEIVQQHAGDKWCKQFGCWDLFIILLHGQLNNDTSLRSLELSHHCHAKELATLGVKPMARSTLSDACRRRQPAILMAIFWVLLGQLRANWPADKTLRECLYLLDSTPIPLKGSGYEWAQDNYRTKGLKVHMVYEGTLKSPTCAIITAPTLNDITPAKALKIKRESIYVYDKAYYDYSWWNRINKCNSCFVTRLKKDAPFKLRQRRIVKTEEIIHDWMIELTSKAGQAYQGLLRHIRIKLPTKKTIVVVSNDLTSTAQEIAALYKRRWEIELFFKCIKQTLKIKRFWGKSENSVKLQIITALIAYVLLRLIQVKIQACYSIKQIAIILRAKLYDNVSLHQVLTMTEKISHGKLSAPQRFGAKYD